MLVVASCDASELFDPVEEPFHEVALPIDPAREDEGCLAVGFWRDVGPGLSLGRLCPDSVAVVALVRQQDVALAEAVCQRVGLGAVGDLARGQAEVDGAACRIDEGMDLAGKAPARTSHAAIVCIPLFPVAACW